MNSTADLIDRIESACLSGKIGLVLAKDLITALSPVRLERENNEQDVCLQLLKGECADYQSLCGRAFSILSEHWDSYTDPEGYGPTSLLRDLEHASKGQPHKDITLLNQELSRCVTELQQRIDELTRENQINEANKNRRAYIVEVESQRDQLAEALKNLAISPQTTDGKYWKDYATAELKRIMEKK